MFNRSIALAAATAAIAMTAAPGPDHFLIQPRRQEAPKPASSRDDRKRRARRYGSLPTRIVHALNRPYVAHERAGIAGLCGRLDITKDGTHRFAIDEPVMCNRCQRERVRLDKLARGR